MTYRHLQLGAALVASLAAGCGGLEDDGGERAAALAQEIAGGYLDADDNAVVGFYHVSAGSLCSGSLIAPNVVLTARHCVSPTLDTGVGDGIICSKTRFGEIASPASFLVTTSAEVTLATAGEYLVAEVVGLPTDDSFCGNDMAILILKQNVDAAIAPLTPRVDSSPAVDEEYSAIGYGAVEDSGTGSGYRRRRDGLFVYCAPGGCAATSVKPTEWTGDTGVCVGDSGGPAVDLEGRVIGVTSRGTTGCDNPIYGDTFGWGQWLKDTVAYASGLGAYPAPGWTEGTTVDPEHSVPIGEPCASAADCFTGRCITTGDSSYCTRACSDEGPCPEGYECAAGSPSVCKEPEPPAPKAAPADDSGCSAGGDPGGAGSATALAFALAALLLQRRRAST